MQVIFLEIVLLQRNRLHHDINTTLICTRQSKTLFDSLGCDICFIAVVWNQTADISKVCLNIHTVEYYRVTKNLNNDTCSRVDEVWKQFAKWKKTTVEHVLYGSIDTKFPEEENIETENRCLGLQWRRRMGLEAEGWQVCVCEWKHSKVGLMVDTWDYTFLKHWITYLKG